ncbi:hypothetical protein NDU88_002453 [Pleurodeles waltl]|uniref:Uncharacterized protein n=1 Tax=Pleurodeles waltl TaxID=8319 RepID=A0AAV7SFB0_PLEWA|nr:hypothetical protein NDU88_002453 [Pleurodeles waltl]
MRGRRAGTRVFPAWMRTMLDNCLLGGTDGVKNWDIEEKYNEHNNAWSDVSGPNGIRKGDWVKIKVKVGERCVVMGNVECRVLVCAVFLVKAVARLAGEGKAERCCTSLNKPYSTQIYAV